MAGDILRLAKGAENRLVSLAEKGIPFLKSGRLHEIHAGADDQAAALAFALSGNGSKSDRGKAGPVLLARRRMRSQVVLNGEGLASLGMNPASLMIVEARSELDLLRAGLEAARCPGVDLVLLETKGRFAGYDLTASRRLALAAERSRTCVIVLRHDAQPRPSAAWTRWEIASAPSIALEADAPGRPAIEARLLRWQGGPAGRSWRLEWNMDHGTFRDAAELAPLPGALVSLPAVRESARSSGKDQPRAA
jgi:protein ImuA